MSGGFNLRLINDNILRLTNEFLDANNWFESGMAYSPVVVIDSPLENEELIEPNMVAVTLEDIHLSDVEIGSTLTDQNITVVIDILAENTSIGIHLSGDLMVYFQSLYNFSVVDLSQATPSHAFYCDIEGVYMESSGYYESKYKKFARALSFTVTHTDFSGDL